MNYVDSITSGLASWIEATEGNELVINPPAARAEIKAIEAVIGKSLPRDLAEFYLQANGIWDSWFCFNIIGVEESVRYNTSIRVPGEFPYYMSRNDHLVFSHRDGSYYFYSVTPNGCGGIYFWDHETDERLYATSSLNEWIRARINEL